jgi:phosphoenolpyruvate carboxykinase (ATP)
MDLGIEPEITFSACFGAPFMVHHPFYYANLLRKKIEKAKARVWLVNTGWIGGKYGVGERISIRHTRNLLNTVLNGKLNQVEYRRDKLFGFEVPLTCPEVPDELFFPENAWKNQKEYWEKYDALASKYIDNFKMYAPDCPEEVIAAGPKRLKDIKAKSG